MNIDLGSIPAQRTTGVDATSKRNQRPKAGRAVVFLEVVESETTLQGDGMPWPRARQPVPPGLPLEGFFTPSPQCNRTKQPSGPAPFSAGKSHIAHRRAESCALRLAVGQERLRRITDIRYKTIVAPGPGKILQKTFAKSRSQAWPNIAAKWPSQHVDRRPRRPLRRRSESVDNGPILPPPGRICPSEQGAAAARKRRGPQMLAARGP